ncbi:MAG: threonine--tRNA ligase [Bacillota bacterium]
MKVTLKDGKELDCDNGLSLLQIAKQISQGLAKKALVAKVNGQLTDLSYLLQADAKIEYFSFEDVEGKNALRHTAAHILAQAVKRLYPAVKLAIGPAIENGFYYDFDIENPFTPEELVKIEKEMQKIIDSNLPLERIEVSREEALRLMNKGGEIYKAELISELPEDAIITLYRQGDFVDLCAGPHLVTTNPVKAFRLLQTAGAYWRGSEKNKMLQRIYGTAFTKKDELEEYVQRLEEAKARDHNKLGRELELFTTVPCIGQGLPLLMPKGAKIVQILQRFVEDEEERRGYQLTKTPLMAKSDLYKLSGHWQHYKDGMFVMGNEETDEEVLALRPMTCPFQFMIYKAKTRSYKDLPIRYAETSTLFRNESSGEMHGLIRVRQFTISEGHLACTPDQLEQEFKGVIDLVNYFMNTLGLKEDLSYRFSKWDPNNTEKYIGTKEQWEAAQEKMSVILTDLGLDFVEAEGEAAFYGPKLDIQARNVHGKEDTLITVQIDFALAERFDMFYSDSDGEKKHPYVIHRTSIGCYERTLALLIEKYAGAFPVWLAPVQVKVMPITDRALEYSQTVVERLKSNGVRVELDARNEKIGYKIRQAQQEKLPYMLVIGDKEVETGEVAVRQRGQNDIGTMSLAVFIERVLKDNIDRVIW